MSNNAHGIEVRPIKDPNAYVTDYWIKFPLSEDFLYTFWKKEKQPSLDDLVDRIAKCFTEWLEENK